MKNPLQVPPQELSGINAVQFRPIVIVSTTLKWLLGDVDRSKIAWLEMVGFGIHLNTFAGTRINI